ncbi:MAG: hypothetical protein FWD47_13450 [Treponema sp.]|nr:hypothetical protein [Treponema sp.]
MDKIIGFILENKEWIFSGVGVAIILAILGISQHRARKNGEVKFKLTPRFYIVLFIGIVLGFGADYYFNLNEDWRLRFFIFGITILLSFASNSLVCKIKTKVAVYKSVRSLSEDDCKYVVNCQDNNEYFTFTGGGEKIEFDIKWDKILYVPTGKMVQLYEPYKICVYNYAYRLAKKRLRK